ncbi:amino acid permease-domain-containing protein [Durotheca rogersii]|uniref:amino acid permease-domain-containing protein n=1 Tax=Durotheca rogersii TaxID=419775 RepID=UPI0022201D0A|nr:amino acid permease-domain-containing protein [Durotheca rogersii]KAI5865531.1 amino acid permease-domain-containing protein [Durotheca rogersii]
MPAESRGNGADKPDTGGPPSRKAKLGAFTGVFIPVVLNIVSILMFLRFGSIISRIGLLGMLGLLAIAYAINATAVLSLSAIASNGEVKGGGAYYLISRSLGPEFGGSIGVLFYLSQVVSISLNIVGLIDCIKLNLGPQVPQGYWEGYGMQTAALIFCTALSLAGRTIFVQASSGLFSILILAIVTIPVSAFIRRPFKDDALGVEFTGLSLRTIRLNLYPPVVGPSYQGVETFRELFGILFSATSGVFAGASMSGDLRNPSKAVPKGTVWAMAGTFLLYFVVILSIASTITRPSLLRNIHVIPAMSIWPPLILAGECATAFFSALMGIIGGARLLHALGRDRILPGLSIFGRGNRRGDPVFAVLITYTIAQVALLANLNQIATLVSMGYQMTFLVMNLACFLLKIGSAPNFRPAFRFFSWHTAFVGTILSAAAMLFIDETYAISAVCMLILLFLVIHYTSPPKHWGDVSQNLIYHQVRKYLLRLKPEHIKFWRPQIILLINNPRNHMQLIQFCNSLKKGSLYILGHAIVTDDFNSGIHEAKLQQSAWSRYISEYSRIKAFVQLTMSPTIVWGVRNLILSAGLGGMRPNIAVLGFYNMDELRKTRPDTKIPGIPITFTKTRAVTKAEGKAPNRRRGDASSRLLDSFLPTDTIRTEGMMSVTSYLTILEDLALRHRLNVAVGKGFQALETPHHDGSNTKKYIDLWPIQMSAEIAGGDKSLLTTNFDTYTLILQLGCILESVPVWKRAFRLRVLVFVEYESEVEEEHARLKALLEKLRIQAIIRVFWLASGYLQTYEAVVNGSRLSSEYGSITDEVLRDDEWWQELQQLRADAYGTALSPQLTSLGGIFEAARRRRSSVSRPDAHVESLRRLSVNEWLDGSRKPTISMIAKLRVNVGIRTHQLGSATFNGRPDADSPESSEDDDGSNSFSDADFNEAASEASGDDIEELPSSERAVMLAFTGRRTSQRGMIRGVDLVKTLEGPRPKLLRAPPAATMSGYGTMNPAPKASIAPAYTPNTTPGPGKVATGIAKATPRPHLSRHSSASRFTSRPTPETKVLAEGDSDPIIMFSHEENPTSLQARRPVLSQDLSLSRGTSGRPPPEARIRNGPESRLTESPLRSRDRLVDTKFDVLCCPSPQLDDGDGSTCSTHSLALSFNDLPSRAQHLVLNELMRQHSSDTAVLLTTLPIPEEGTGKSEEASLRYLSDIEVLCHELPPVLLVLSNNMTVTVGL